MSKTVWSRPDKDRMTAWVEKWRGLLMLNSYQIMLVWSSTANTENALCSAEIRILYPYRSGHTITFYPHFLDDTMPDQERMVVHELCHLITNPLSELASFLLDGNLVTRKNLETEDEHVTDWLANILVALQEHQ